MNEEFIPLTEEQIIAAEKGELKLKLRNGVKVVQLTWGRPPLDQSRSDVLIIKAEDGELVMYYKDGRYNYEIDSKYDLFVDEEETAKLKQPTQQANKEQMTQQYEKDSFIEVYDECEGRWVELKFLCFDGDVAVCKEVDCETSYMGFNQHRSITKITINGEQMNLSQAEEFINKLLSK